MTIFDTAGRVLAFNCFIKTPTGDVSPRDLMGGARHRAYGALCQMADSHQLRGERSSARVTGARARTGRRPVSETSPILWEPRDVVDVPASANTPSAITAMARQLSRREMSQLVQTFEAGLYEMGAIFVWTRTMAGLKKNLAGLGLDFIAEMLDRPDIRVGAEIHEVLTDFEAVRLAEELGMFGSTHALRMRHTLEVVTHFANPPSDAGGRGDDARGGDRGSSHLCSNCPRAWRISASPSIRRLPEAT